MAEAMYISRPRLNDVLNNTPGMGREIRPKVRAFLERELPEHKEELLAALGWTDA